MGNIPPSILRQPLQWSHHHNWLTAANKGGDTEIVRGNTRTYYFRRCKRKRLTSIESLPDDLLFKILVHLRAQDIYDEARLVCRKWNHMIHTHNFIYAHLQSTTYGLLFQSAFIDTFFMAVRARQGRIEISKFNYKFRCRVRASCNGLLLGFDHHNLHTIYIANPVTKQIFVLPPISLYITGPSGIAYAPTSMEYKVVLTFPFEENTCVILTVGVDKSWRNVHTKHLSVAAKKAFLCTPRVTEGFLHWPGGHDRVLTLNVETEFITEIRVPNPNGLTRTYLSTGRFLSLLSRCSKFSWEVWEMKPETGEWRKLPDIALEAQKCAFERFDFEHDNYLSPIGW